MYLAKPPQSTMEKGTRVLVREAKRVSAEARAQLHNLPLKAQPQNVRGCTEPTGLTREWEVESDGTPILNVNSTAVD